MVSRGSEKLIAIKTTASVREIKAALGDRIGGAEKLPIAKAGLGGAASWGVGCAGGRTSMRGMK